MITIVGNLKFCYFAPGGAMTFLLPFLSRITFLLRKIGRKENDVLGVAHCLAANELIVKIIA
jgi:hypothetical protein